MKNEEDIAGGENNNEEDMETRTFVHSETNGVQTQKEGPNISLDEVGGGLKQVQGTTRCVNSDKGGENCKVRLYLLICFVSSCHLTKPQTFGTF